MIHLVKGQNFAWPEPRVTAYLDHPEARVCALLLGPDFKVRDGADLVDRQRPSRSGVDWLAGPPEGVTVDLTRVDPSVEHILCVTSAAPGAPVLSSTVRLVTASGTVVAELTPDVGPESAVVLVEIYRRGEGWKVRAVGQGYAGGLAQACSAHGLQGATSSGQPHVAERSFEDLLRQTRMILDDASRTTASLRSTREFARRRWETELEEVVADPALRLGERGDAARRAAQERHDVMVGEAEARHRRDLDQLSAEIAGLEAELPAPLARWESAAWTAWQPPPELQPAVRLGELALPEAPRFAMPFLIPLPLSRPLWVEIDAPGESGDEVATAILRTVATRVLIATTRAETRVAIIDIGGRRGTLGLPDVLLDGPPATDASTASATLTALVEHLELLDVALSSDSLDALDVRHQSHRLLLIADFPVGLDESTLHHLVTVIEHGPRLGVHVLVTGTHAESLGLPVLDWVRSLFLRVPSVPGGDLVDGFGGVDWTFLPDAGPADPQALAGVLLRVAAARTRTSGLENPSAG